MEFLGQITWVDVLVVLLLAIGALLGWTQGFMRYLLSSAAVLIAFAVAAWVKRPLAELLEVWTAFTPAVREMLLFLVVFLLLLVALWLLIRSFGAVIRLPVARIADEIGGALMGIFFAALIIVFTLAVLDSYYAGDAGSGVTGVIESGQAPLLRGLRDVLSQSLLVGFLQDALLPSMGLLVRPFVPEDVRAVL